MRQPAYFTSILVFLSVSCLVTSSALSVSKKDAPPQVLQLPIQRKSVTYPVISARLRRRDQTVSTPLINGLLEGKDQQPLYYANISIGTPAQEMQITLDTGSSDLWTIATANTCNSLVASDCTDRGRYNANSSSTYKYLSSKFNILYRDGRGTKGDFVTDTVSIGDKALKDMQFGVVYSSTIGWGTLGIGYINHEQPGSPQYPNLPQAMVNSKLIQSKAYSLWLDDYDSSTGSLLFGGVDTEKYTGSLQTLPIQNISGVYQDFILTLTGLAVVTAGQTQTYTEALPMRVAMDSGTSLTILPIALASKVYSALQVPYNASEELVYCDCALATANNSIDFTFTSLVISVPVHEMVIRNTTDGSCFLGITPTQRGGLNVLGDTFLRSAYVVYDLKNNEISLAQSRLNSNTSNIKEIGTGPNSVPGAIPVLNPVLFSG